MSRINEPTFFEKWLPSWANGDESRELDEEYEAAIAIPEGVSHGEALCTGQRIVGTGIPLEEVR